MASIRAYLDDFGKMKVYMDRSFYGGSSNSFYVEDDNGLSSKLVINSREERNNEVVYELTTPAGVSFGTNYYVREEHGNRAPLVMRYVVNTAQFIDRFNYSGNDLGSRYEKSHTDFAVWSPVATSIILKLRVNGEIYTYPMVREKKGVYRVSVKGDLKNATYTYLVERNGEVVESIDPYAISSTGNAKESAVIDLSEIEKIKDYSLDSLKSPLDAIIYETNVRDMTSSKKVGTSTNGTYLALSESDTEYKGLKTGLSYLEALGVTHVQLLPVLDYATVDEFNPHNYNWGYDPVQYLTPEGSYSSNPNDPYARVKELKTLVTTMHKHNMRVVLDVVFNHVYDVAMSSFDKIMPYYYFRYNDSGYLSNGSYCGNDFASEKIMVRRYILYVVEKLFEIYKIDGLRFDLMGILDIVTMNEIVNVAKKIKKDALIYGEGWDLPTSIPHDMKANMNNSYQMLEVGHFNDFFRDVVKGKTSDDAKYERGYITGDTSYKEQMKDALTACIYEGFNKKFNSPKQSINALETHDNHTIWDKMHFSNSNEDRDTRLKRQKMLIATTLLAQGIPFIHMGEEYCATKNDYGNTYNAGDKVNQFDAERAIKNKDIIEYTKKAIAFRKSHDLLRLKDKESIEKCINITNSEDGVVFYEINANNETLRIMFNPTYDDKQYTFEEGFKVLFDVDGNEVEGNEIFVPRLSVIVSGKGSK